MNFNSDKMKALVLYLARAAHDDYTFGRVKLAKLLYYVDMEAYLRRGESITGATYMKRREGPAAREFVPVRDQMIAAGDAVEVPVTYPNGRIGKKLQANTDPDESLLDDDERGIADEISQLFAGWSGAAMSEYSHNEIGWQVATLDQPIPYYAYFLKHLTEPQKTRAEQVVVELNLLDVAS